MINPFSYDNIEMTVNIRPLEQNSHWRRSAIDFPAAFPGIFQDSDTAYGEYYQSFNTGKSPLVILVHGWGDHSSIPMKMLARSLSRRGMHCFFLYLPFHSKRLPPDMKKRSPNLTPEEWFAGYRIAVTDIRQFIDCALTMDEIDSSKIAVVGLSLGAFTGSIAMGVEERIKAGVFIVSGGNSQKISQNSRFSKFRGRYRIPQQDYESRQKSYLAYLDEVNQRGWENVETEQVYYLIDPLTYASQLKGRPVLMINARWDEFIPDETATEFCQACGTCEQVWLPATHPTIWLYYPLIARKIRGFLQHAFN